MKSEPRIAAYLGVKDEIELIEPCIAHLRSIGVGHIMVCDMSSTDGTAEILEEHRSDNFNVLTLTNEVLGGGDEIEEDWKSHALGRCQNAPADWVIFLDADEFWLPASGSLKNCAAFQAADVLTVERYNVVLGPDGPLIPAEIKPETYDQVLLFAERAPDLRRELQQNSGLPWLRARIMPKVMVRPSKLIGLTPGQHDVIETDPPLRRAAPRDLIIAHMAISSRTRFTRKIHNIRSIYIDAGIDVSLPGHRWQDFAVAWHWRRWASLSDSDAEFKRNITDLDRIAELRVDGVIKSACQILAGAGA